MKKRMKNRMIKHKLLLAASFAFCFSMAMPLRAQPSRTPAQTLAPEWVSLWNGKDFSGWKKQGNEKWIVEDGAIYGEGVTKEYGYLATEKTYKDFHLSLRFKCEADGNSGVYIHTRFDGDTAKVVGGRQVEIDRRIGRHTGGLYGDGKGWIVWPASELETVIDPTGWNDLLILVEGNRYRTYLNGVQMIDFTYPSPASTDGVIALQLHSGGEGRMRFKDIWIRDLTRR
jgi:hypothetical protein